MKTLVLLLVGVLAAVIALPAHARNLSSVDGNTLLADCHATQQMGEVSPKLNRDELAAGFYCLGFVQGVVDADNIWQTAEKKALGSKANPLVSYCVPDDVSWPQLVRVLVKWLEDNPAKLNLPGYDVIHMALDKAYPCPSV
jgi:hypothetical protein